MDAPTASDIQQILNPPDGGQADPPGCLGVKPKQDWPICLGCGRTALPECDPTGGVYMVDGKACPAFCAVFDQRAYSRRFPVPVLDDGKPAKLGTIHPDGDEEELVRTHRAAMATINRMRPGVAGGMVIAGRGYGIGKTYLAAACLNHIRENSDMTVAFVNATGLIDRIKATFDEDADEDQSQLLERLRRVDVLCIDDIGKQRSTDFADDIFFGLIAWRYENLKPIIVTTNMSAKELLKNDIWGASVDRLIDHSTIISFESTQTMRRAMRVFKSGKP